MIAAALLLAGASCAYFNTFYNARAHFKKAERIQKDRDEESGVSQSAIGEYDFAIEKCNKVIQRHSGSRWVDDAILLMGRAYFGKRDYVEALDKFQGLIDAFPKTNLRHQALFMVGLTYYRMKRPEEGRRAFDQLLGEKPDFERKDEILAIQAQSMADDGDIAGAVATYRRILREFPGSRERVQTLFNIGELYMQSDRFDSAYVAYEEAMRISDDMKLRLEAREHTADALFREKRVEEALENYRTILDLAQDLPADERVPIELKIASCLSALGDTEKALDDYKRILEASPGTVFAAEAAFQTGLIWELRFGDYTRAQESYEAIGAMGAQATRSIYGEQAESRKRNLRRLIERGITSAISDTAGGAEADGILLLAEHFLFQETDTLKALEKYEEVCERFPGTTHGARASYARAWLTSLNAAAADSSDTLFVRVLREYPGTPQALQVGEFFKERGLEALIPEGALDAPAVPADSTGEGLSPEAGVSEVPSELGEATESLVDASGDSTAYRMGKPELPADREAWLRERPDLRERLAELERQRPQDLSVIGTLEGPDDSLRADAVPDVEALSHADTIVSVADTTGLSPVDADTSGAVIGSDTTAASKPDTVVAADTTAASRSDTVAVSDVQTSTGQEGP